MAAFNGDKLSALAEQIWADHALPVLHDYIRIPNVSPAYEPAWRELGHMGAAARLLRDWSAARPVAGLTVELIEQPGLTPLLLMDIPATAPDAGAVLIYGHLDKQPEMTGWRQGLGPWEPVRDGDRLYGRGSADDGYATCAALAAVQALREAGGHHGRVVVLIEAGEESGSPDLPAYVESLAERIGTPSLVVALDSGCATYDRLWLTTSLRGLLVAEVTVSILKEGIHSGNGGPVPSSFRILRRILDRIEDSGDGRVLLPAAAVEVPEDRQRQMAATAEDLGPGLAGYPFVEGAHPRGDGPRDWLRARTWEASVAVTGMDGLPPVATAGNVLRPFTSVKLSIRLPPTADAAAAARQLRAAVTDDPPYGADVHVRIEGAEPGWNAPPEPEWLTDALRSASTAAFGRPAGYVGEGGSIPFVGALAARFPDAAFLVTGVLGPESNAHGPNEFLHVPTAVRVTEVVARLLQAHAGRPG